MEGPINDLEDFSPEERVKLVEINMKESEIEDYVLNKEINKEWVIELDDILNESFDKRYSVSKSEMYLSYLTSKTSLSIKSTLSIL